MGMVTHPSILAWRTPWTEEPVGYSQWSHKESDMTKRLTHNRAAGKLRRKTQLSFSRTKKWITIVTNQNMTLASKTF